MNRLVSLAAVAAITLTVTACVNEPEARKVLEAQGFTDIKINGYQLFGCGKEDFDHTGFTAVGPSGKTVTGVVCGGWLKGSTVRFF